VEYGLIATLSSEDAANRLIQKLVRRGLGALTLSDEDPIVEGRTTALLVVRVVHESEDVREASRAVRACLPEDEWHNLAMLPMRDIPSLLWVVHRRRKPKLVVEAQPDAHEFDDQAWFARGDSGEYATEETAREEAEQS
jgi:hypothetical protein